MDMKFAASPNRVQMAADAWENTLCALPTAEACNWASMTARTAQASRSATAAALEGSGIVKALSALTTNPSDSHRRPTPVREPWLITGAALAAGLSLPERTLFIQA